MYEEHFLNEEIIELPVKGIKGFKYKRPTTKDELDWLRKYQQEDRMDDYENIIEINRRRVSDIVDAPYSKETINKIIGIDKEYKDLSEEERWNLFNKLDGKIFEKITLAILSLDGGIEKKD